MDARSIFERGNRYRTYRYGRRFGAPKGAATAASEIEQVVTQDDEWAKNELISSASDAIKLRESVKFGAFASQVFDWRPASSLLVLRDQINRLAPKRSKSEDGFIGDADHAKRNSDHNPWIHDGRDYVVSAFDITQNPDSGCDAAKIANSLVASKDARIKYIIWNRRIINSEPVDSFSAWVWRHYGGRSPHTEHIHLSVLPQKALYDNESAWNVQVS